MGIFYTIFLGIALEKNPNQSPIFPSLRGHVPSQKHTMALIEVLNAQGLGMTRQGQRWSGWRCDWNHQKKGVEDHQNTHMREYARIIYD